MADFVVPRHSAVMERLRRRIELFRRHHGNCESRYERTALERLDLERQQTFALHQRCLQSKAKRSSKQRQTQAASEPAAQRGAGGDGGSGEQGRNGALVSLPEAVKRKPESTGSPVSGEVNGFGDAYPPSKKACLEEGLTGNGTVPPRSPLDTKHGISNDALSNGSCSQGAEQNGDRILKSAMPCVSDRLREMKQEPMDDILPSMQSGGSPSNLLPDLNLNEQEWRELMEEFNRSVPYEDIQDIFKDGFDERKDPELATPTPLPQTPLAPDQVNIKAEFSPAPMAFEQEPRTVSPQVRPTSSGSALHSGSPVTCPSGSTVPSPALPVSQPVRQLPPSLSHPGPSAKDLSPAQQLQQLAAREQQRTQLMQQQQMAKFQVSHQAGWSQAASSQNQLAGAYSMEKPNSPALYSQDISNPKQLMMPNHKNSPKAAGSYLPSAGHSGQAPVLDYNNTRPLSHFQGSPGPRGPSAAPLTAAQQNEVPLLTKQKPGLPFRPHLSSAQQEQSPYPQGPPAAMTSQPSNSTLPGSHSTSVYTNVSLEQRKQFLSHQQLMVQTQQMQRHLTRPPPQYQDQQNSQNPFQQQVSQFAGSSQKLTTMGTAPAAQRIFPGVMGMAVGQSGGPPPTAPPTATLAEMSLPSCAGGGLDGMRVPYSMNPQAGQAAGVSSTPLPRQPAGSMAAPYRQQHLARMPTSMPNAMANGMVNSMPNTISTSMPSSVPNGMQNTLPHTMPSPMPNPMSSGMPTSMPSSMPTQSQAWQAHSGMQQALGQPAPGGNGSMQSFTSPSYRMQPRLPKLPNSSPFAQPGLNTSRSHSTVNSPQMMASLPQQRANSALAPQPHPRALAPPPQQQQHQQQVLPGISVPMSDMASFAQSQGSQVVNRPSLQCNQGYQVNRTASHELPFGYNDQAGGSLPTFPEESDLMDSLLKGHTTQEWMDDLDELLANHQ